MNRIGKRFHFIWETSVKNEIKFFRSPSRGMERVNASHDLQNGWKIMGFGLYKQGIQLGCVSANPLHNVRGSTKVNEMAFLSNCIYKGFISGQSLVSLNFAESSRLSTVHPFTQAVQQGHTLSREWLAQLWLAGKKRNRSKHKRLHSQVWRTSPADSVYQTYYSSLRLPHDVSPFSAQPSPEAQPTGLEETSFHQPLLSQSLSGILRPSCPEEVKIAPLLARSNLLIARDVEWANLMFGFEQENRYAVMDPTCSPTPVGFIREQSNIFMRQLLRTRRYFVALITDATGNELFRVRRPPWLINSTIYVDIDGKEMGVVHRRWHLWRRIYDLYLGKKQFAVVENAGFWDWTFTLKDENGKTLAEIDRNWRGFGFEMFTDAGQYVIRFGDINSGAKTGLAAQIQELQVSRALTLLERAVTVALAVSLDNDYFSRHSRWGIPFIPFWGEEW